MGFVEPIGSIKDEEFVKKRDELIKAATPDYLFTEVRDEPYFFGAYKFDLSGLKIPIRISFGIPIGNQLGNLQKNEVMKDDTGASLSLLKNDDLKGVPHTLFVHGATATQADGSNAVFDIVGPIYFDVSCIVLGDESGTRTARVKCDYVAICPNAERLLGLDVTRHFKDHCVKVSGQPLYYPLPPPTQNPPPPPHPGNLLLFTLDRFNYDQTHVSLIPPLQNQISQPQTPQQPSFQFF